MCIRDGAINLIRTTLSLLHRMMNNQKNKKTVKNDA